jgi:uncharacterized membrane protein YfcA
MTSIIFIVIAFLAEIAGTIIGFGSSTLSLPFAVLLFNFEAALVLVAFLHIFGSLSKISFFKEGLKWGIITRFGIPSALAGFVGALLVTHLDQNLLRGLLGIFLVSYVLYSAKRHSPTKANTISLMTGGSLSGFLAGLIGTGGALRGAFLNAYNLPKEHYIATAAATALMVDSVRIVIYVKNGFLNSEHYFYLPILLLIAIIGTWLGKLIVEHVSQKKFKNLVLIGLLMVGIKLIFDWLS